MKKFQIVVAVLGTFTASPILANPPNGYDPAEVICKFADDDSLRNIAKFFELADTALPNVPPEEAKYLEAENSAALRLYGNDTPSSNARFAALYARPLYEVWEIRKSLDAARKSLQLILDTTGYPMYKKSAEGEKLRKALQTTNAIDEYASWVTQLMTIQERMPKNLPMTGAQMTKIYAGAVTAQGDINFYMGCKLAKLMGYQTFN